MTEKDIKILLYKKMVEIRQFEDASLPYFKKPGHGSHHPCLGHEAIESAIGAVLGEQDYLFGSHRSHGILLTKGLAPKFLMAELWGKETGYCRGRGGSMHVVDLAKRVMVSGIVGTCITLAVGAALAIKLRGEKGIAVASFGDGATNCGAFHEGINMASVWHLPVIFICENNGLAVTTHLQDTTPLQKISVRAKAYSIPGFEIDGTDPLASYSVISESAQRARTDGVPSLIVAKVPRLEGHAAWDQRHYLTDLEIEETRIEDPLPKYEKLLTSEGILTTEMINSINTEMKNTMEEALRFAEESPAPPYNKEEASKYVYASSEREISS